MQVIIFNDWITPNVATADGDVDVNFFEHKPFLAVANSSRHFGLVAVAPGLIMPMGLFSHKIKSLADIPNGAQVAVANDPINRGRGLELFAKAGLITLKPGVGDFATVGDITANPKHLHFVELDAPQLVRALDDVEVAQVSFTFLLASGGTPLPPSSPMARKILIMPFSLSHAPMRRMIQGWKNFFPFSARPPRRPIS